MAVNKYQPYVMVLPEDDANARLATGFQLRLDPAQLRQMDVLPVAAGWIKVLDLFESVHVAEMDRSNHRFMVLLIDFDRKENRLQVAKARIPARLAERVFVLGALDEPEDLRRVLGSYESIGLATAKDCREGTDTTWGHELLRHNASELGRLNDRVRPILFPAI
jgi:hypothetical protein